MESDDTLDQQVRWQVYDRTMRTGTPPLAQQVATALQHDAGAIRKSLARLGAAHILVLQPDNGEILMANPFSAVPTPFAVELDGLATYGNCIWDALGIPAMLDADARIRTSCGDCGAAAEIHVTSGEVLGEGLMHFAIPAMKWWDDIVFN